MASLWPVRRNLWRWDRGVDIPSFSDALDAFERWLRATAVPEIISVLNQEINRANALPDVKEKLVSAGLIVVTEPPEFFASTIKSDYAKYGKLIRDIGFQPQ